MAKEIPYFKFFVGEWANGDITAENYKTQGVFINICSIYWTKEGKLSEVFLKKKLKANKEISNLINSEIIKVENGFIKINFLDEQLSECETIRAKNSAAGKASAAKRKSIKSSTPVQHPFNTRSTKTQPLREDKIREDKIREDKEKKSLGLFPQWKDIIRKDEVFIRNLFQELQGQWTHLELYDLHKDLNFKLDNYKTYCDKFKIKLLDEKHIKNSFKKFAKVYWNKTSTQIEYIK